MTGPGINTPPELSRPLTLEQARRTTRPINIAADTAECAALAVRFKLITLDRLTATLAVAIAGDVLTVTGALDAAVTQRCIATGQPLPARIAAPFTVRCVPAAALEVDGDEAEVELADDDLDTIGYDGGGVDLGELVAQSLALALDPWPRHRDADAILKAAGVKDEGEAGAFGALAALRDKLNGG